MKIPIQYSVKNVFARRWTTAMTASGMALVVFVFAAVLMLAHGLERTLVTTGSPDNVVIVRRSATSEVQSFMAREQTQIIMASEGIAAGSDGPLAGAETVAIINLPRRNTGNPSNVQIRGASSQALALRPQVTLVQGRMWKPGSSEVIVGRAIAERFQGAGLGETIRFALRDWTVVGTFDAEGSGFDSEIWVDVDQMMQAFRRSVFSSVIVRLHDPNAFEAFAARLNADPRLTIDVSRESEYYGAQSEVMANFIRVLGLLVTIIFSLGAIIGAMITMYAAVANRTQEIGTLRALGFGRGAIASAFVIESLALSLVGGALGVAAASGLQFITISALNFSTFTEIAFGFVLSPAIVIQSIIFSLAMGLMGGVLPAIRAGRLGIVDALRMP